MDNQVCDRHSSARAQARVLLPSLGTLYVCVVIALQPSTSGMTSLLSTRR